MAKIEIEIMILLVFFSLFLFGCIQQEKKFVISNPVSSSVSADVNDDTLFVTLATPQTITGKKLFNADINLGLGHGIFMYDGLRIIVSNLVSNTEESGLSLDYGDATLTADQINFDGPSSFNSQTQIVGSDNNIWQIRNATNAVRLNYNSNKGSLQNEGDLNIHGSIDATGKHVLRGTTYFTTPSEPYSAGRNTVEISGTDYNMQGTAAQITARITAVTPTSNVYGSRDLYAMYYEAVPSQNGGWQTGNVAGITGRTYIDGDGRLSAVYGSIGQIFYAKGAYVDFSAAVQANTTSASDMNFFCNNCYGFYSLGSVKDGNFNKYSHFYASNISSLSTGTINTQYGVNLPFLTSGKTNWQIYSTDGNSAFGGKTRFGGLTAPTVAVDVTGTVLASKDINAVGKVRADENFNFAGTNGLTKTLLLTNSVGGSCSIDVNGGIITKSDC